MQRAFEHCMSMYTHVCTLPSAEVQCTGSFISSTWHFFLQFVIPVLVGKQDSKHAIQNVAIMQSTPRRRKTAELQVLFPSFLMVTVWDSCRAIPVDLFALYKAVVECGGMASHQSKDRHGWVLLRQLTKCGPLQLTVPTTCTARLYHQYLMGYER